MTQCKKVLDSFNCYKYYNSIERDKETKRQRDKETKRQRDKEAKRQTGKQTAGKQLIIHSDMYAESLLQGLE